MEQRDRTFERAELRLRSGGRVGSDGLPLPGALSSVWIHVSWTCGRHGQRGTRLEADRRRQRPGERGPGGGDYHLRRGGRYDAGGVRRGGVHPDARGALRGRREPHQRGSDARRRPPPAAAVARRWQRAQPAGDHQGARRGDVLVRAARAGWRGVAARRCRHREWPDRRRHGRWWRRRCRPCPDRAIAAAAPIHGGAAGEPPRRHRHERRGPGGGVHGARRQCDAGDGFGNHHRDGAGLSGVPRTACEARILDHSRRHA